MNAPSGLAVREAGGPEVTARPFRRRLVVNSLATTGGNLWAIAVSMITLPVLLDALGRSAFGTWALLQTFSAFTGWLALADLGVGTAAVREIAARLAIGDSVGADRLQGATLAWFAAMGLLGAGAFAVFGSLLFTRVFGIDGVTGSELRKVVLLFACQIVVEFVLRAMQTCLEGRNRVDLARGADAVRRTICLGGAAAALAGYGLVGVAAASFAGAVPACGFTYLLLRRSGGSFGPVRRSIVTDLVRAGRGVALIRPIGVIHRTMDRVIVGVTIGPAGVALVEIATQVANAADALLSASSSAVTPGAAWLDARGERRKLGELLVQGTRACVLVTLPVALLPALLAAPMLRVWVGTAAHLPLLVGLALVYVALTAPVQVGSNLLVGTGRATPVLRAAAAAIVVNLVASAVLVRPFGVTGAFAGTLVSAPFLIVPLWRAATRCTGVASSTLLREGVVPALLPGLLAAGVALAAARAPLPDLGRVAVGAGTGLVVYAVAAWTFALTEGERAQLRRWRRRSATAHP